MTSYRSYRGISVAALLLMTCCGDAPQHDMEPWEAAGRAAEEAYRAERMDQAESGFREALRLAEEAGSRTGQMRALEGLAAAHASSDRLDIADSLYAVLLQTQLRLLDADSLSGMVVVRTLGSLGEINLGRGEISRAETFFAEIFELDRTGQVDLRAEEPALAFALQGLGRIHAARGQTSAADSLQNRVMGLRMYGQGFALYVGGDLVGAEEAWRQALELQQREFADHVDVARTAHALGQLLELQTRADDALRQYHRAAEIYRMAGSSPMEEARVLDDTADLLQTRDPAQGDSLRQRAAQIRRSVKP
jgi:tetratricopeptide (TPR) repeat protein